MSNAPVDPAEVPVFTGDLDLLESKVKALSHGGSKVATAGSDVHKSFGGLSAFYKAPEAEQLFGVTKPVERTAHRLSEDMHVIAKALGTYAREITPLVHQLNQLKQDAAAFRDKVAGDEDWREDGDLIEENLGRRNKIAEVWAAFQAAERACHAKIVGLVGGHALHTIDASHKTGYGYDAEALKQSKSLPWGDAVEESVPWWQVWEHAYDFGKGVIVDGAWGTVKGLLTLFGWDGADAAGEAWKGLAKLSTSMSITLMPVVGAAYWLAPGDKLPSWLRDSRTAMVDTGKALVAWDQWESNGSRAAGAVTFNVITALFTRGGGAALSGTGKAATAAKALSIAAKAGEVIDPMTYVFKGAGAGLSKLGDVIGHLKNTGHLATPKISDGAFSLPEGAVKLPDGTVQLPKGTAVPDGATKLPDGRIKLPEGTATFPPHTVKDPVSGRFMDGKGALYNEDGSLFQRAEDAPKANPAPPTTGADNPRVETPTHQHQPVLAGIGGRGDDVTRVGSDISDPERRVGDSAGQDTTSPGGKSPTGGHGAPGGNVGYYIPTNSHTPGGGRSTNHTPDAGRLDHSTNVSHTTETGGTGSGGHGADDQPSIPHESDGPVDTGGGHDLHGNGGGDDLGHTGDEPLPHEPETPILPGGSEPRPDGARYIEEPDKLAASAARFYDEIRANPDSLDVRAISDNTGISPDVLARVRDHFFLTEHAVAEGPGVVRQGYFTPRKDIADIVQAASEHTLVGDEAIKFERFIAHEYVESHLLEAGVPYIRDHPELWEPYANENESGYYHVWPESAADAGAHDLAASERRGGFNHWAGFGLDVPIVQLSSNLANIDEVMAALFEELRSKGIELK
ncbi:hypothetical protein AB0G35_36165 [Streptomyces sp. NPDC021749]|uniref:hypothetical protein n=1 Tax=Streptomyces sp. NPDC021749 TaxID=3154905 RepID=UPI0033C6F8CA